MDGPGARQQAAPPGAARWRGQPAPPPASLRSATPGWCSSWPRRASARRPSRRSGRATVADPVAWISVDLLDESPADFWRHVIEAIRSIVPTIDDEPRAALEEDPASRLVPDAS